MTTISNATHPVISNRPHTSRNEAMNEAFIALSESYYGWGLTAFDLAARCPAVSLEYIKTRLNYWCFKGLLHRRKVRSDRYKRKLFHYRLSDEGRRYLNCIPKSSLAKAKAAIEEKRTRALAAWREKWAREHPQPSKPSPLLQTRPTFRS